MTKLYVITGTYGDYSDRRDWNVCATLSETRAKELVKKLTEFAAFKKKFKHRIHDEFEEQFNTSYPPLECNITPTDEFRRAENKCKNVGTYNDKQEYKRLQQEHMQRRQEHTQKLKDRTEKYCQSREQWEKDNYFLPNDLEEVSIYAESDSDESEYDYCELELI